MTFGGKILATFRKLYQPAKSQQKQRRFFFLSFVAWPWACFLNEPNAAASVATTAVVHSRHTNTTTAARAYVTKTAVLPVATSTRQSQTSHSVVGLLRPLANQFEYMPRCQIRAALSRVILSIHLFGDTYACTWYVQTRRHQHTCDREYIKWQCCQRKSSHGHKRREQKIR